MDKYLVKRPRSSVSEYVGMDKYLVNELSRYLQEKDQNIIQAMRSIALVKIQLQDYRDRGWDYLIEEVEQFCIANKIEVTIMDDFIESRLRQRRDGQQVTNYHHYRREIFLELSFCLCSFIAIYIYFLFVLLLITIVSC